MATEATISREKEQEILVLCDVARAKNSNISLGELIELTSLELTDSELRREWQHLRLLVSKYALDQKGLVVERRKLELEGPRVHHEERLNRLRAQKNISFARRFCAILKRQRGARVISISGSTSYLSVPKDGDLDFFCIAQKDAMWIFLFRALIFARFLRASSKDSPWLCLSYVMDEEYAQGEFASSQDALFARDALTTRVLHGIEYYNALLVRCGWMANYFPRLYHSHVDRSGHAASIPFFDTPVFKRVVNMFLYHTAGAYIRVKSYLLNRKLAKEGKTDSNFLLRIGRDHCIYESFSYMKLRSMYIGLSKGDSRSS